jgi:IS6 family transposase
MAFYGYARVSTNDQDLDLQIQTAPLAAKSSVQKKRAGPAAMDELSCNCCWIFCVRHADCHAGRKYGISYRELQDMLAERGVNVDHSTIYRWVQRYAPEMEKRLRWYWRNPSDLCPWHMDETYVKVNGRWAYLYRAVDSRGRTVDFYLSSRRNSKAAYRFLGKILNNVKKWQIPRFINTDKAPAYGRALALLKREGRCPSDVEHRQIKYRNNVIECDHGKLKRIIGATLGFKSMKTAYATIKGIEVMRALRKGQASAFYYGDPLGEMRL